MNTFFFFFDFFFSGFFSVYPTSMDCGTLNIVGTKVNPVLFVRVEVEPEQSQANIMVERVELGGSEAVRSAGGTFNGKINVGWG